MNGKGCNFLDIHNSIGKTAILPNLYGDAGGGGAGGARAPPSFGISVNPIRTKGADYAHLITTGTPGFSDLPMTLSYVYRRRGDNEMALRSVFTPLCRAAALRHSAEICRAAWYGGAA